MHACMHTHANTHTYACIHVCTHTHRGKMMHRFVFVFCTGVPTSERQLRGSTNIKQLDDEEQEAMRVVGKVGHIQISAFSMLL